MVKDFSTESPRTYSSLVGKEGMEKKMETTIMGYIRIHSFIPSTKISKELSSPWCLARTRGSNSAETLASRSCTVGTGRNGCRLVRIHVYVSVGIHKDMYVYIYIYICIYMGFPKNSG